MAEPPKVRLSAPKPAPALAPAGPPAVEPGERLRVRETEHGWLAIDRGDVEIGELRQPLKAPPRLRLGDRSFALEPEGRRGGLHLREGGESVARVEVKRLRGERLVVGARTLALAGDDEQLEDEAGARIASLTTRQAATPPAVLVEVHETEELLVVVFAAVVVAMRRLPRAAKRFPERGGSHSEPGVMDGGGHGGSAW